jgi:hypothetical protein
MFIENECLEIQTNNFYIDLDLYNKKGTLEPYEAAVKDELTKALLATINKQSLVEIVEKTLISNEKVITAKLVILQVK